LACLVLAIPLVWVTYVGSLARSCGVYDGGPDPGAQEAFCGYAAGEPVEPSLLFVLLQLIPAIPLVAAGHAVMRGRPRLLSGVGLVVGVLCAVALWNLQP
jgi:hypothetical protein